MTEVCYTNTKPSWYDYVLTKQDLGLAQILPMLDEETNAEPRVLSAKIADPYLLLIRDDGSVFIAQIDNNNELEEMDKTGSPLTASKWSTGCLYTDTTGAFQSLQGDKGTNVTETIMMFLTTSSGALHVSFIHVFLFITHANHPRFMLFLISLNHYLLLKGCLSSPHTFLQNLRSERDPLVRPFLSA